MKTLQLVGLVMMLLLLSASPLLAQTPPPMPNTPVLSGASFGAGIGAGVAILGAGYGFARIGAAALESMARQPEAAGRIQTAMIIVAALLEGVTFFALVVCIILQNKATF